MAESLTSDQQYAIRLARAKDAYQRNNIRIIDSSVRGCAWLVTTPRGIFGVSDNAAKLIVQGWFFGIHRHHDIILAFENCGRQDRTTEMGRIIKLRIDDGSLVDPQVLTSGLHNHCHQLAVIDGLICLLDTENQAVLRFTLEGQAVDVRRPFPAAPVLDQTGAYVHMNALAQVGDRLAVMLHNGGAEPKKFSELAWLDRDWTLIERHSLPGHCCHDIVEDEHDVIWHCSTMSGDIIGSDGTRINITDQLMTRGLALGSEAIAVGVSTFGPRGTRDRLPGGVVILDRSWKKRVQIPLPAPASDIIAL